MFDPEGHIVLTPKQLFALIEESPKRVINDVLTRATPVAFDEYQKYCDFLDVISKRLHVPPMNLFVRGSCQMGFSIAPRPEKVWIEIQEGSDIDLAVVDVDYFNRVNGEVVRWEQENRDYLKYKKFAAWNARRLQNRRFRCVNDKNIPEVVCVWHEDCMQEIDSTPYCGIKRKISAFIFRDWWALRKRYEYDLRQLRKMVADGGLIEPPDAALP